MKPITPQEVADRKVKSIPPEVIEVFNDLIAENFSGNSATVTVTQAVTRIKKRMGRRTNDEQIVERGWLDIEPIFRETGWDVVYDQPGYNESYEANYTFTVKK